MNIIKWNTFAVGLVCGLLVGFGIFTLFGKSRLGSGTSPSYRFEKGGPGGMWMMRLDARTGKAWRTQPQNNETGWNGAWKWEEVIEANK